LLLDFGCFHTLTSDRRTTYVADVSHAAAPCATLLIFGFRRGRVPGCGRCVAIAVPDKGTEKLVAIIEFKNRGDSQQDATDKLVAVKREVTSAISNSHGLGVADLVVVAPGSIPITTSGKVRRAACVEQYRHGQFGRLDA
jgi:acyl-CoA synthetase (AMP-forming)/AMP-acid ligase II